MSDIQPSLLNTIKMELLWYVTARRQYQLPGPRSACRLGTEAIIPSTTVRNLGIYTDADLSMRVSCSADCRWLCCRLASTAQYPTISINVCFPNSACPPCVVEVGLWQRYTLADLPANLHNRLQSVLNAAARLIAGLRLTYIHFSVSTGCIPCSAHRYLSDQLSCVTDMPSRSRLRSSTNFNQLTVRPSRLVTTEERSFAIAGAKL